MLLALPNSLLIQYLIYYTTAADKSASVTKAPREGATGGAPALANARKSPDTSSLASQSGGHPSPPASVLSQSHQSSSKLANLLTQAAASQTKELVKAQKFKDAALGSAAREGGVQKKEAGKQQAKLYKEAEKSEEKEQSREAKVRWWVGGWLILCACACVRVCCSERHTESDVDAQTRAAGSWRGDAESGTQQQCQTSGTQQQQQQQRRQAHRQQRPGLDQGGHTGKGS